jgi:HEAT repeat protein
MADPKTNLLEVNLLGYALAAAGEDGVTKLLELLGHDDFSVHTYAAEGLGSLGNRARRAVPALCRALEHSAADWTGFTIIRALGNIGGPRAVAALQTVAAAARRVNPPDGPLVQALEGALAAALAQE